MAGHETKCAHLHGHNYVIEITARATDATLDDVGRVIDFGVLKERVGSWIEDCWDHGFLLWEGDAQARQAVEQFDPGNGAKQKVYLFDRNPTAEVIAEYLLYRACPALLTGTRVTVCRVVVHETENCSAVAELPSFP